MKPTKPLAALIIGLAIISIAWQGSLYVAERLAPNARARTVTLNGSRQVNFDAVRERFIDGEKVWINEGGVISGPLVYDDDSTATPDGGVTFSIAGGTGRFIRQFEGPVSLSWFGAVADWNGTTGTDSSIEIGNAITVAAARNAFIHVDGDYYTAGTHDITTTAGITGGGSINGTTSLRASVVSDGQIVSSVNYDTLAPAFESGIQTSDRTGKRSWSLTTAGVNRPIGNTQSADLQIDLGDHSNSTWRSYSFRWTVMQANSINNSGPRAATTVIADVTAFTNSAGSVQTRMNIVDKIRPANAQDSDDIQIEVLSGGADTLTFRIRSIATFVQQFHTTIEVIQAPNNQALQSLLAKNKAWTLTSGLTAITESNNEVLRLRNNSGAIELLGNTFGTKDFIDEIKTPLGVYATMNPNWTVTEATGFLQSYFNQASTLRVPIHIIGRWYINDTIDTGSNYGTIINGYQKSDKEGLSHGIVWQGGVDTTKPMLTFGTQFAYVNNLSLHGHDTGETTAQNLPKAGIAFTDSVGIAEGNLIIGNCAFYALDHGIFSGLESNNANKSDSAINNCQFTSCVTAGFRTVTQQNVNFHFDKLYANNMGDAPLLLCTGGGTYTARMVHMAQSNELLKIDADSTQTGINGFQFDFQTVKFDGNTNESPRLLAMTDQGNNNVYRGLVRFRDVILGSSITDDQTDGPYFTQRGNMQLIVEGLRLNKGLTPTLELADVHYGGNAVQSSNSHTKFRDCRFVGWDGTLADLEIDFIDDAGFASAFYYEISGCMDEDGLPFPTLSNRPGDQHRKQGQDSLADSTGATNIDMDAGSFDNDLTTVTGATTFTFDFAGAREGYYSLTFVQDGTGGHTITLPSGSGYSNSPPAIASTTAGARQSVLLYWDGTEAHYK